MNLKKITLLLFLCSFIFPKYYVSYDASWEADVSVMGESGTLDGDGALALGFENMINQNLWLGFKYDILPGELDNCSSDCETSTLDLYGKYMIPINNDASAFLLLGYALPVGDFDDVDAGIQYGFGVSSQMGLGMYYTVSTLESTESMSDGPYDTYSVTYDIDLTRIGITYSF